MPDQSISHDLPDPNKVRAYLVRQLHDSTHVGPDKWAHPNCPHCQDECSEGVLALDGTIRRALGLMGGDDG